MPSYDITNPSDTALAILRERITDDASLEDAVKQAVLADLAGDDPTALTRLKAVLAGETEVREVDGTQSE
jgi:hypothetical protein